MYVCVCVCVYIYIYIYTVKASTATKHCITILKTKLIAAITQASQRRDEKTDIRV